MLTIPSRNNNNKQESSPLWFSFLISELSNEFTYLHNMIEIIIQAIVCLY